MLGALAAGGWAMTQEVPSKARFDDRVARTATRPKSEAVPRKEAAIARPKANIAPRQESPAVRPKADVEPRKAEAAAQQKPEPGPQKTKPASAARPKAESALRRPTTEIETASITRAPTPLPRPKPLAKETSAKSQPDAAAALNVLYTRTTVYLRQRANIGAPVLHKLRQGESVRVFAHDGKWTLVSASGRKGWVHDDDLRPADPTAPRPKEALGEPAKDAKSG